MGNRKTTIQFKKEVYDSVGEEYEVLSEYVGAHKKLTMRHNECGFVYPVAPNNFLQGRRCPKCNNAYTMTTYEFKQRVYELTGDAYEVLGKYTLIESPIEMKHECGYKWKVKPKHFLLSGSRCPRCSGNLKVTQQQFDKEVVDLVGDEYQIIGKYKNTDTPIEMIHKVCNRHVKISRAKFLDGNRCRYCAYERQADEQRKTTEQYIQEIRAITADQFEVVSEYVGAYNPIKIKHLECGETFELSAARNMLVHPFCRRCSCRESNGEKLVRFELEKRNWPFEWQYRFNDCRDTYPLPFDFAVFSGSNVAFLIEYDGHGHYHPVSVFGGEMEFEERKRKDKIKDDYCLAQGIPLLRIPYFENRRVREIIDEFITSQQLNIR